VSESPKKRMRSPGFNVTVAVATLSSEPAEVVDMADPRMMIAQTTDKTHV
jgi:hypothetical protein